MNVARYLYVGADRPMTYSELAEQMGVTHREAMHAVQAARLAGVAIVSGPRGLWIASTSQEALEAAQALRRRAITQLVTARALRAAGKRMAAIRQPTLWEEAA